MTQALGVDGVKSGLKTVLVSFDDHQVMAVEVERLADGRVVVFASAAFAAASLLTLLALATLGVQSWLAWRGERRPRVK